MKKVVLRFTIITETGKIFGETLDYSKVVHEWISNGANGTKDDVLNYIREGVFTPESLDKGTVAYGYLESLSQSDSCPDFLFEEGIKTIEVKHIKNGYKKERNQRNEVPIL